MYSTIIPKKEHLDCGCYNFNFSKRRCKYHATIEDTKKRVEKSKSQNQKPVSFIKEDSELEHERNLKEWFAYHMANSPRVCENCGASLSHYNEKAWHGSQHHILEKSLFDSVKCELENHAVLGYYCCHGQWHSSYEKAMQMPIWNLCVGRVQSFLYLVKEKHKILDLFNIEIENKILENIIEWAHLKNIKVNTTINTKR